MDKLKGVVGLGGKHEEGQEPVSGTKGEGTAAAPFDKGNEQEATQAADKTEDTNAGESAPTNTDTSTSNTKEDATPKEEKKGGRGFLKTLGLGGGGGKKKEEEQAQTGAEKAAAEKEEKEKHLPPNHLGSAVPEGASTDLADPGTVAPGQTDGIAAQEDAPRSASVNSGKLPDRSTSVGSSGGLSPDRARGGAAPTQLPGSRGEHRGSMVPADAPKYRKVENPDRIPTAGGKKIGEEQYQTRRASVAPPSSPPPDMKKLDREGSPDPTTAENTASNVAPATQATGGAEGKNTAPQQMKDFTLGDSTNANTSSAAPESSAAAADSVAPDEGPKGEAVGEKDKSPVAAAKDKLTPGGKEASSSGGGHARRGSVFDKIKEKVKGHKSKS